MAFCPLCGSLVFHTCFCDVCEKNVCCLINDEDESAGDFQGLSVHTLFDWNSQNEQALRSLILVLKGGRQLNLFRWFAERLALTQPSYSRRSILVCAPSRGGLDHAGCWALALSAQFDLPLWLGLRRATKNQQKTRTKHERRSIRMERPVREILNDHLIFVDDVITTGATAKAAQELIPEAKSFQVWALARRSLL